MTVETRELPPPVEAPEQPEKRLPHVRVAVIGAGFSGLGMAIRLRMEGEDDFVVLERAADLGGTWRDNSYPGSACDVMSLLYSYSFAPNTEWRTTFGSQDEILGYLHQCADRFGVRPHIRFGEELISAEWLEDEQHWRITTSHLELTATVLVTGSGYLSTPALPDVPGIADFDGPIFHTSSWDHSVDLTGKRVAVVGTGASAVQVVPAIIERVGSLTLYQRTPAWVAPKPDREISQRQLWLRRHLPGYQRFRRNFNKNGREVLAFMLARPALMSRTLQGQALKHLAEQVPQEAMRAALTPDYTIGCKRILFSNTFYPALAAEKAALVPHAVTRFGAGTVHAGEDVRDIDVVVLATGYQAVDQPIGHRITGRNGQSLAEHWRSRGRSAYAGTTVTGFPNLFMMLGPNTALGHSSQTVMIEAQLEYVLATLRVMRERELASVEVRPAAQQSYNEWLQGRLSGTVWQAGGCVSWYQEGSGDNPSIYPTYTWQFRRHLRQFNPDHYLLRARPISGLGAPRPASAGIPGSREGTPRAAAIR